MHRVTRITTMALSTLVSTATLTPLASATTSSIPTSTSVAPLLTGQLVFSYAADTSGKPDQLAIANANGTGLRTITPSGPGVQAGEVFSRPRVSPDGMHLSMIAGNNSLLIADPDGSNATAVPLPAVGDMDFVSVGGYEWSADGSWLYITETKNGTSFLAAVHPDGTGIHEVLPPAAQYNSLSVAGRTGEIGWMDPGTFGVYKIFNPATTQTRTVALPKTALSAALSPDGQFLAVGEGGSGAPTQIEVVPTDGSPRWVAQGNAEGVPTWSPDESQLAFVTEAQVPNSSQFLPYLTVGSSSGNHPGQTLVPTFNPPASSTAGAWVPLPVGTPLKPPTAGTPTPTPNPNNGPKVYRDAGADRIGTGIAISQQRWPTVGSAKAVVLATSLNYPDALSGGPLAAKKGGPLLLTNGSAIHLDPRILAEIQRVLPRGGAVHVLGGDGAMNPGIVAQLKSLGYAVTQYKGLDRADTALKVARDGMGSPQHVVLATGAGFADALAAGPYAAGPFADASGAPAAIVLSDGAHLDSATAAFLHGKTVATVGAQAGHAWPTAAKSFSGLDRFDTAARVAREFTGAFANTQVGIANGVASATNPGYPDALTGGAFMAESNGPIVLVDGIDGVVPAESRSVLATRTGNTRADLFGGTAIISPSLAASIVSLLHGTAQF